jgi:hypothetical protein
LAIRRLFTGRFKTVYVMRGIAGVLTAFAMAAVPSIALAAEEATIKAFASWQGSGQVFETGVDELTFVGALSGTVYVETDKGPIDSGRLVCPALVRINTADSSQSGTARCTITAKDGARIFAQVSCTGIHLIGCDGQFDLVGGTERFEGISGGGAVTLRSEFRRFTNISESSAQEEARGILFWPALQYKIP